MLPIRYYASWTLVVAIVALGACRSGTQKASDASADTVARGTVVDTVDSNIWAIHEDASGNHWFGSNGSGLYKYDGDQIVVYTMEDGLIDNTIRRIQSYEDGSILIDTPLGVSKYDGNRFTTLERVKGRMGDWQLTDSDLWFTCNTTATDILRYDGDHFTELPLPRQDLFTAMGIEETLFSFDPYDVFGVNKDANGHLWIGTAAAGAFRYDGESFLWIGDKDLSILNDGRVPGVRAMLQDHNDNYWLSNFTTTYRLDTLDGKAYTTTAVSSFTDLPFDGTTHFMNGIVDKSGNLWMTAYGSGVWRYGPQGLTQIPIKTSLENLHAMTIYNDVDGDLWLGTQDDGVYKWDQDYFKKVDFGKKVKADRVEKQDID